MGGRGCESVFCAPPPHFLEGVQVFNELSTTNAAQMRKAPPFGAEKSNGWAKVQNAPKRSLFDVFCAGFSLNCVDNPNFSCASRAAIVCSLRRGSHSRLGSEPLGNLCVFSLAALGQVRFFFSLFCLCVRTFLWWLAGFQLFVPRTKLQIQ